jgi:hypothetical protein
MKRYLPFYILAAAILLVGAIAFGVPTSSLWIVGLVVPCPLMMIFMMGGMHGGVATASRAVTARAARISPRAMVPLAAGSLTLRTALTARRQLID